MIILFDRDLFVNALYPLLNTVAGKNTLPSLEGVHLICKENSCKMETFDNEKGMNTTIACDVVEEGNCIINANKLISILKVMPEGEIKLVVDSGYKTVIEKGLSHFEIKAYPGIDFPKIPDIRFERGFEIPQYLFRKIINQVNFAVSQSDLRPIFTGAYFEIQGENVKVVACDGNRLAIMEKTISLVNKNKDGTTLNMKFILPGKTLSELLKLLKDTEDTLEIKISRHWIIFCFGKYQLASKTIDSEYIDYNRILPAYRNIVCHLQAEELRGALERSNLIIEDRAAGAIRSFVKFNVDEKLSISTVSITGNVFDEIDLEKECGGAIEIAFNCRYLLDSLRACEDGDLTITFSDQLHGVLIEQDNEDEGTLKYYVMPVRMNN